MNKIFSLSYSEPIKHIVIQMQLWLIIFVAYDDFAETLMERVILNGCMVTSSLALAIIVNFFHAQGRFRLFRVCFASFTGTIVFLCGILLLNFFYGDILGRNYRFNLNGISWMVSSSLVVIVWNLLFVKNLIANCFKSFYKRVVFIFKDPNGFLAIINNADFKLGCFLFNILCVRRTRTKYADEVKAF